MNAADFTVEISQPESSTDRRIDWDRLLCLFNNATSSGSESQRLIATNSLRRLCHVAPDHVIKQTIPILVGLIESSCFSVQKSVSRCLNVFARLNGGSFCASVGESGGIAALLGMLQRNSEESQKIWAKCLRNLVEFEHQNRVIFARIGGLEAILGLIPFSSEEIKVFLLEILSAAVLLREMRRELVGSSGLSFLIQALSLGSMGSRARAAHAIGLMSSARGIRRLLVNLGVSSPLLKLMRDGTEEAKLTAANSLGIILSHVDYLRLVAQEEAIPLYADLLEGDNYLGKEIAEDVFCILSVVEENCSVICEHLVRILRGNNEAAKVAVADVLWGITGHKHSISVLGESGAVPLLIGLLQEGEEDAREKALGVLVQMSYEEADRRALADHGAIPVLIDLLRSESEELQEYAIEALVNFAEDPLLCGRVSHVLDDNHFQTVRNRLMWLRDSDEHLIRSL